MQGRRAVLPGDGGARIEGFDVPEPGPAEVLVRVGWSLISPGTELAGYRVAGRQGRFNPGYTAVGEVLAAGAACDPAALGQTVFVFPDRGDSTGCHATHKLVAPGGLVLAVPAGLDPATACFARMANIALTPFVLADPRQHGWLLVMGLGLVGNFVAQVGRLRGWRVIGADPDPQRRKRAIDAGLDVAVDPSAADLPQAVRAASDGRGADLTVNATGRAATFPAALAATADGGELSTLGGARGAAPGDLSEVFSAIHGRHVTVRGGWELSVPRRESPGGQVASTERNLRDAFRWLAEGALRLGPIWTHTIRPEEFATAYDALHDADPAYLGVIVDWRG